MFFKKCVFSVSGTNAFGIYNNKGMQLRRKQVAVEYSLIQQYSPYLSLLLSKVFLKLSGIVGLKFCNDQSFSLTKFFTFTIKEKAREIYKKMLVVNQLQPQFCSWKTQTRAFSRNFIQTLQRNSFNYTYNAATSSQAKRYSGVEVSSFRIVFWKKYYCFEEDLLWNTFQILPSIQQCSKLNTSDHLKIPK